ncbi:MAG: aspartate-semialdehyde dehydrogenase [Salibacteraceae bacterium]
MKVAVVGATGMVGQTMLQVLEERNFPVEVLIPVASEKSVGKKMRFKGKEVTVVGMEAAIALQPDLALFSAGGSTSTTWAPRFAEVGTTVIDNSSAWRMDPACPLVVPEVNAQAIAEEHRIIANPNCSTIQLVMALSPLQRAYGLKRVVVSTYQSVTGTGVKAVEQLENERKGVEGEAAYPHPIDKNCLPHCDVFFENGYTREELKLVNESRKILGIPDLRLTATAVRVPVVGGHSEAVNLEFEKDFDVEEVRHLLAKTPGILVVDDPASNTYPMPRTAHGRDEVFVGRIRRDESQANSLNLWIVSDNLRKGAATNAVQIAEFLLVQQPQD